MERTVSYDYFIDANGNRVKAATDNGGNYITVTAASLETVYRYSVYGVTKNADGSFRFIYKNNSTNDFYLVTDDGSMKRIDTFSLVTMPYFDRPSEDGVIDYSVIGTPFCYRVVERVNGEYADIIESYMIYPEIDYLSFFAQGASYGAFSQTYLRARPSEMGGNSDRTYILLSRFTYSDTLPQISFTDESISSVVKTTGRVLKVDGGIAADFTGAGVEFNVVFTEKGPLFLDVTTSASIGGSGMTTASTGECFISVYVDGVKSVYYLAPGENSVLVGELSIGTHNIRAVKENEAQYALLTFNGVRMNGTMGERPADKELYIEFVGDSITSGFGNVTTLGSGSSNPAIYRESATQSYGYLTAEALDADYSIVSRAGTGLTSGCSSQYTAMYPYADFVRGKDAYVPERQADIVVINLGTNDLGKATEANVPSEAKAILAAVRAIHGEDVTVIWAYDMMNDGCINAIMTALEGEGVHFVRLTRNTDGLYAHPNAQGHAASAEILSAYIEGLLAD
jgi:lysophospholipase L1-like esterase